MTENIYGALWTTWGWWWNHEKGTTDDFLQRKETSIGSDENGREDPIHEGDQCDFYHKVHAKNAKQADY